MELRILAPTGVLGESVYDTATVTGTPAAFTATGTVTYTFYPSLNGTGTPISTQTVTLSGGVVPNSAATVALAAGSFSYVAVYSGDSNYTGSTGAVEPSTGATAPTGRCAPAGRSRSPGAAARPPPVPPGRRAGTEGGPREAGSAQARQRSGAPPL